MLASISVGHDEHVNILEPLQMFNAVWENLSITAVLDCWYIFSERQTQGGKILFIVMLRITGNRYVRR